MLVLGLKCYSHDTGAAILSDEGDKLSVCAISEARLNRRKHSFSYPLMSIDYCLRAFGLQSLTQVDLICIDRHIETWPEIASQYGFDNALRMHHPRYDHNYRWNYLIEQTISLDRDKVLWVNHLDAHAATAYFASPFDEAAVLVAEGGTGIYKGSNTDLVPVDRIGYLGDTYQDGLKLMKRRDHFVNSSFLFDKFSAQLGYDIFGAGQTMALAGYGHNFPRKDYVDIDPDRFDDFIINHDKTVLGMTNVPNFEDTQGQELLSEPWVNLARQAQETLEEDILYLALQTKVKTGSRYLCLAGGAALNCIINRKIYDSGYFEDLFIQPAASDEGIPLGCALWGYYSNGGSQRWHMDNAYLGVNYGGKGLEEALAPWNLYSRNVSAKDVALELANEKIIGRISGKSEYGPRALGNRSILADPRSLKLKNRLNREIKHREKFRPFAPTCLEGQLPSYFNAPKYCPFMNIAGFVLEEGLVEVPAVVHADGSCRIQTVSPTHNNGYHSLINEFGHITGCPVLLNTSFNDQNEPIIETYQDAVSCFLRTGLDALYVENKLVKKTKETPIFDGRKLLDDTAKHTQRTYNDLINTHCDPEKFVDLANRLKKGIKGIG